MVSKHPHLLANEALERARRHLGRKEQIAARGALDEAIRLNNTLADAYLERGKLRLYDNDLTGAVSDFSLLLSLSPEMALAHAYRGTAYARNGQEEALATVQKAVALKPDVARYHSYLGRVLRMLQRYGEAIVSYRRALELDATDPEHHNSLAWVRATCPVDEYRNGPEAKQLAEASLKLPSDNRASYQDTLACACAECGDFEQAVAVMEQALAEAKPEYREEFLQRLAIFRASRPYRDYSNMPAMPTNPLNESNR